MHPNISQYAKSRRGLLATLTSVIILILVLVLGLGATAMAERGHHDGAKPTVVLVHGAWADASGWSQVAENLQHEGYTVVAPANPLRSLRGDSAYLASFLQTIIGPIILVGHSYGGAVITNAALGNTNVKALVYINAFAPDEGETLGGILAMNPGSEVGPSSLILRPYPLSGGGRSLDAYIRESAFRDAFAADVPRRTAAAMAASQRPIDPAILGESSGPPAWKTIPSWSLVGSKDNTIPPATERFMGQRAHAQTVEINSSHVSMISHPEAVTRLVLSAARSVD
jgi:pimeloyl-ACP methyl ester carboxylesterase